MNLLSSVPWGKPAENLLNYIKDLNSDNLISVFIRHSEREEPRELSDILKAPLTEQGKYTAFEFGKELPNNINYRIFHSILERCIDTAEYIEKGIIKNKGKVKVRRPMKNLTKIEGKNEKFLEYLGRDSFDFINFYLAGHYPPEDIEPAIKVAQRTASELSQNSLTAETNSVDIYVTHDFHVLVYLFYWGGIFNSSKWIQYLDGFILQFNNNKLKFYYNGEIKEVNYPYWWNKIQSKN
jgi:broad specificity phosphatase PhoE